MKVESTTVSIEKTITVEQDVVQVTMSKADAYILYRIMGTVAGAPSKMIVDLYDGLATALGGYVMTDYIDGLDFIDFKEGHDYLLIVSTGEKLAQLDKEFGE